ncbi:unnamed protein product [Spirodela intermedia]|uniref:Methyltransferase n=1 Tax=Spirodela intermedia TaxID=51605 RepID=A0A7I8K4D6_SPIIN|nr:unnamed protein product [Spirodela intermedia]
MAGGVGSAPRSRAWKLYSPYGKYTSILSVFLLSLLCAFAYFLGRRQDARGAVDGYPAVVSSAACSPGNGTGPLRPPSSPVGSLDFLAHHAADAASAPPMLEYAACDAKYSEYTPCEDRERSLKYPRERLVYRERHCPGKEELLKCLVPAPRGYRRPFPWPASREVAWFANVPHRDLAVEKAVQNWIRVDSDKFRFPGGGTMFPRGADAYIDEISELIPLRDGSIRTAVDTGCGVASWGAYLLSRNVLAMSFAPRDTHEAQVQFALERGVPAMIGVMASQRLPYPARAFDMAHCSRCLIPWHLHGGQFLIETHWRGWQRTQDDLRAEQDVIEDVARKLCWKKVKERGDIAIWRKPTNHVHCGITRKLFKSPPFCSASASPDAAWYTKMETCITSLPEVADLRETAGGELKNWPERLTAVPPRINSGSISEVTAETFLEDSELWRRRLGFYKTLVNQLGKPGGYRNLLDMNAHLGGFAAALAGDPVWVMNVVPPAGVDTLGVVYERGLIGTYHDWCEAMSTYPRSYDLLHAGSVFTLYRTRCDMEDVLLEMDRILRPDGAVIFRDDVDVLVKIKSHTDRMRWESQIMDPEGGPLQREKILLAVKQYWTAADPHEKEIGQPSA